MDDATFTDDAPEHGSSAPLEVYRRAYATVGVPWPGEQEVRRRHRVSDAGAEPRPTAEQRLAAALGWAEVPQWSDEEQRELDAEFEAAQAQARRRTYATAEVADSIIRLRQAAARRNRPDGSPAGGRPLRSADDLVHPGTFDSGDELQEFLAELHATRQAPEPAQLVRDQMQRLAGEVRWLRRAVQALLHHHGIQLPDQAQQAPPAHSPMVGGDTGGRADP